ncbi:MAG: hypothetical protein ABIL02_06235 [candidate division WOR-3 bacterium]
MRRVLIGFTGLVLVFVGCQRVEVWRRVAFWYPNWTPDGKIVCWQSNALVKEWEYVFYPGNGSEVIDWDWTIIEMNQDGSNMRQIVKIDKESGWIGPNFGEVTGHPCISCAGDEIVFSLWNFTDWPSELIGIFVVNRDGRGLKKIVHKGTYPDLSPDGKKVVYEKPGEGIWIINVDGTGDHQITNDPRDAWPAWSPLGDKIAFAKTIETDIIDSLTKRNIRVLTLNLIDTAGGNYEIIWQDSTTLITEISGLDFSWDGEWIHFGALGSRIVNINDHTQVQLPEGVGGKFSPDGTMFVGQYNGIWTVKIDGTDKKEVIQNISRQEGQGWEIW